MFHGPLIRLSAALAGVLSIASCGGSEDEVASVARRDIPAAVSVGPGDCSIAKVGTSMPANLIGEPVTSVTITAATWFAATETVPAYCRIDGAIAPINSAAPDIEFAVALPATWTHRAVQVGGAGSNGVIPALNGAGHLARGWAVAGSDSGHKFSDPTWAIHEEAYRNLGYLQMKKTHDAAWELIRRMYGTRPVYSYWVGSSQGGREGLTVVQRYPADYDGVVVTVPVLNFTTLQLSQVLRRIQEKPLANWVPTAKTRAIATEIVRQCDALDGLADGVINNYMGCRAQFDVRTQPNAWVAKRCPDNSDPAPQLTTAAACLTDGQIASLNFTYTPYQFATPLAFGTPGFGMWVPNISPQGDAMMDDTRYRGQEGAAPEAPVYSWRAAVMVLGGLFQDHGADPLSYLEGGALRARRQVISEWMDATNPDLTAFYQRGGKLISVIGTNDGTAAPGAQLDYYQAVIDRMGRSRTDAFARLYVMPQGNHGLGGNSYTVDGNGAEITAQPIPNAVDRVALIADWTEKDIAPSLAAEVTASDGRSLPLCSYPQYPRYRGAGLPTGTASSYVCTD